MALGENQRSDSPQSSSTPAGSEMVTTMQEKGLDPSETSQDDNPESFVAEAASTTVYKYQYTNISSGRVVLTIETDKPIEMQMQSPSGETPVFEVITTVTTSWNPSTELPKSKLPPVYDITRILLKINSPAILSALQTVVDYYPECNYFGTSISIPEPYELLVHHEKELADYRNQFVPGLELSEDLRCERNANVYEHLGTLQAFLQDAVGASVQAERQRHARGFCTFDMLWMLYKPGTDVYYDTYRDGSYDGYVVQSLSGGVYRKSASSLRLTLWFLIYDGWALGRIDNTVFQPVFEGEKPISQLKVIPCEFWSDGLEGNNSIQHRTRLEERGKMYYRLTARQCMSYNGYSVTFPRTHYEGLVVVDAETYYLEVDNKDKPQIGTVGDDIVYGVTDCDCNVCAKRKGQKGHPAKAKFSDYDWIYPTTTKELTPHQYFLCDNSVIAFHLQTRDWRRLNAYNFSEPGFDESIIDTLVVPDERRDLIKALAQPLAKRDGIGGKSSLKPWTADFVAGKGVGKIFLLHGKPGVGKTYTAECIAEYNRRPLLSLTISDLGTEPEDAENNLKSSFQRARLWDAMVLIDEADIFMERRENQDLERNSLVSAFLRALETCQTTLFLTTNRVGSFDDAFISRIHISLYYPDFTEADRKKVWWNYFEKLIKDRGDVMRVPIGTKDYTQGQEVKALKWNGREIRNAFQTAVALAEYGNERDEEGKILLKDSHIMQIVRMSEEFKSYLKTLHQGDESKRAERQRIRLDEYDRSSY